MNSTGVAWWPRQNSRFCSSSIVARYASAYGARRSPVVADDPATAAGVVRGVLQSHPDVACAHVRGRKAALVGNLVVADVVLTSGETKAPETLQSINEWCAARLPDYGVPRRIKLLDAIPAKETLKSDV